MENEQPAYVTLAEGTIASDYALKSLNKALGEAQNEFTPAVKGEVNTYGGYKYTPLVAIIGAVRPSLTKYHLTVSQFPSCDLESKTVTIYTRIVHWDSGEWMQNALELPAELALGKGGTPVFNQQTIGGSETYGMKYSYKPIVGIPNSEEMIDSTDEKGDLPSRPKAQRARSEEAPRPEPQKPAQTVPQGPFEMLEGGLLRCVVRGVTENHTKGEKLRSFLQVTFNGYLHTFNFATCFDTGLFDAVKECVGKVCTLKLLAWKEGAKFINIADVFEVDGVEYVNGKPSVDTVNGDILSEGEVA